MTARRAAAIILATGLLASPLSAQARSRRPLEPETVAGCYDVARSSWYSLPMQHGLTVHWPDTLRAAPRELPFPYEYEPPSHVRLSLDSNTTARPRGHILEPAGPDTLSGTNSASRNWWISRDTVFLRWSTGFIGPLLMVSPSRAGLEGVLIAVSDVIGPTMSAARVMLLRARCRDEPPR